MIARLCLLLFLLSIASSRRQTGSRGSGARGGSGGRGTGGRGSGGGGGRNPQEDTELSTFLSELWRGDSAKARYVAVGNAQGANVDIRLNVGGRTNSRDTNDVAANPLFSYVNEPRLLGHQTTRLLIGLFNDFRLSASIAEDQETNRNNKREVDAFLTAIINTDIMKKTYDFVRRKNMISNLTPQKWRSTLYRIWFKLYSRHQRVLGSSGFEHVFLGEIDDGQAKGIHNWIWIYKQEKAGHLDYKGQISRHTFNPCVLRGRFALTANRRVYGKPMTSLLVGATPEFELAMFTLAFLKHPNAVTNIKVNQVNLKIQTYKNRDGTLSTAYLA